MRRRWLPLHTLPEFPTQMATHWTGFQQPIIDERNPDYTEYRVVLTRYGGTHSGGIDVADYRLEYEQVQKDWTVWNRSSSTLKSRSSQGTWTESRRNRRSQFAEELGRDSS